MMMGATLLAVIVGWGLLTSLQSILWLVQQKTKNAGWADVGWVWGMVFLVVWYAVVFDRWTLSKAILSTLVFLWAIRLGMHLMGRILHSKAEDSRYAALRQKWGDHAGLKFFLIHQLQPLFNIILSVPFLIVMSHPQPRLGTIQILAVIIWIVGFVGEALADEQLKRFKRTGHDPTAVCCDGLWRYSRHPNLFFEWLIWVAYFVFALGSPNGWIAFITPVAMLVLLLKITGVPLIEKQALEKKGHRYREYMKTTSVFFPWFAKRVS